MKLCFLLVLTALALGLTKLDKSGAEIVLDEKTGYWVHPGKETLFDADINSEVLAKKKKCLERHPLVLIPGIGGSRLIGIGTIDNSYKLPGICSRTFKKWEKFWMRWDDTLPFENECFMNYLSLEYKPQTGKMGDLSNLTIIPPQFGNVYGVEYISDSFIIHIASAYYHHMISYFEGYGWKADSDILGAPYDWRKLDTEPYFRNLSQLIIDTYNKFDKTVDVVSHSMGGLYMHMFLRSEYGKKAAKYIHNWHVISAPWVGAELFTESILSGNNFHLPMPNSVMLPAIRTFDGAYTLLPSPYYSSYASKPVVEIAGVNYTARDYDQIIKIANISRGMDFVNVAFAELGSLDMPSVPTTCYYTYGHDTIDFLSYKNTKLTSPSKHNGEGDGTVNLESLKYSCEKWGLRTLTDKGDHLGALSTTKFLDSLLQDTCDEFEV